MPPPPDIEQQLETLNAKVDQLRDSTLLLMRLLENLLRFVSPQDLSLNRINIDRQALDELWIQNKDSND